MSKHVSISLEEAIVASPSGSLWRHTRIARSSRYKRSEMALFPPDTHFVVFTDAKDPTPSQELHSREALAPVFADLNQYDNTICFARTDNDPDADRRVKSAQGLVRFRITSRLRAQEPTPNRCHSTVLRHLREDGWHVADCGA